MHISRGLIFAHLPIFAGSRGFIFAHLIFFADWSKMKILHKLTVVPKFNYVSWKNKHMHHWIIKIADQQKVIFHCFSPAATFLRNRFLQGLFFAWINFRAFPSFSANSSGLIFAEMLNPRKLIHAKINPREN